VLRRLFFPFSSLPQFHTLGQTSRIRKWRLWKSAFFFLFTLRRIPVFADVLLSSWAVPFFSCLISLPLSLRPVKVDVFPRLREKCMTYQFFPLNIFIFPFISRHFIGPREYRYSIKRGLSYATLLPFLFPPGGLPSSSVRWGILLLPPDVLVGLPFGHKFLPKSYSKGPPPFFPFFGEFGIKLLALGVSLHCDLSLLPFLLPSLLLQGPAFPFLRPRPPLDDDSCFLLPFCTFESPFILT